MSNLTDYPSSLEEVDPAGEYVSVVSLSTPTGFKWVLVSLPSTGIAGATDTALIASLQSEQANINTKVTALETSEQSLTSRTSALESADLSLLARTSALETNQETDVAANVTLIRSVSVVMPTSGSVPNTVSSLTPSEYTNGEIVKVENSDGSVYYASNGTNFYETGRKADSTSSAEPALDRTGIAYTLLETDKNRRILVDDNVTVNQLSSGCLFAGYDILNISSSGVNIIGGSSVALTGDTYLEAGSGLTLTVLNTGTSTTLLGMGGKS